MSRPPFNPVKPRALGTPKAAVCELIAQAGGIPRVMVKLGIGQSDAYAVTDPQSPKELSFARVAALTAPDATAGAEYLVNLAGGVFLPIPRPDSEAAELTADAMREFGEASADLVQKLAGGLTSQEARSALGPIDEALRALVQLRQAIAERAQPREAPADK